MFSAIKFFKGFNVFDGERLAKLLFYGILIAIGIGIYHKVFIAKDKETNQKAEKIVNYNYELKQTFGCNHLPKMIEK